MKDILFIGSSTGCWMHYPFVKVFFDNTITYDNSYIVAQKDIYFKIKNYNLINLSLHGAGNFYIAGRLFEYIKENKKPDYIFLKFTGLNRWDFPFDKKVDLLNYQFQRKSSYKNWVASGGYAGSWTSNDVLRRIFSYIYDMKDQNSTNYNSLQQVFLCLFLCETLKIPHNWTFYYDVTNPPSESSKQDGYIDALPAYISKKQMLEFTPLNFSYLINEIPNDGNHYSRELFVKYLNQEIIYNKIKDTIKYI